jgi:hypothetical protein
MHVQSSGRFGDVAIAHFVDAMDMFPAHASGRHWMKWELGIAGGDVGRLERVALRLKRDLRKFIEKMNYLAQAPANLLRLRQRNHALIVDPTQAIGQQAYLGSLSLVWHRAKPWDRAVTVVLYNLLYEGASHIKSSWNTNQIDPGEFAQIGPCAGADANDREG